MSMSSEKSTGNELRDENTGKPGSLLPKHLRQQKKLIDDMLGDPFLKAFAAKLAKTNNLAIDAFLKWKRQMEMEERQLWGDIDECFGGRFTPNLRRLPESDAKARLRKKGARI